jgi:uncharacterized protein (TIGR03000 family)
MNASMQLRRSVTLRLLAGLLVLAYAGPLVGKDKDAKAEKTTAKLLVKVRGDALLEIQGDPTKQTGPERGFESPPLDPTKEYEYTLVAKWEPNNYTKITRTYKVPVKAGETVKVDMTKKNPKIIDDIVIRYVPTPPEVVDLMCKMGGVGKEDVVYDLGCGDGRIVIAAVGEKWGAKKGVGVDLDPERIKESKENAKKAGVEDKVEFRMEDVFKVAKEEIDQASVVMLYMSNDTNEQLRPILQAKLKPGSRIVSHRFLMGDWKPDKTEKIEIDEVPYEVHLWTIKPKEEKPDDKKEEKKD